MAVFLGVSRNTEFRHLTPGDSNYWCVSGESKLAAAGDLLLLYFPRSVSAKHQGISQIYKILSDATTIRRSPCASRGMNHIDTQLLINLSSHITAKQMKEAALESRWGALRRNFQGVTFSVPEDVWNVLESLIVSYNPESKDELVSYSVN